MNLLAFIITDTIFIAFNFYLYSIVNHANKGAHKWLNIATFITIGVDIVLILALGLTKNIFIVQDGKYIEQSLVYVPYIFSGLILVELMAYTILNRHCFSKRQLIVILIYQCLPIPSLILEVACPSIPSLAGVFATLSILIVYVLAADTTIQNAKVREQMLEEISNKDILTDLNNRRAFYNEISKMKPDSCIGIIYCDINGLKYVNDHFGHNKGDDLIRDFSKILVSVIDKEFIYRIAGDEFVVLIPNIKKTTFDETFVKLYDIASENHSIASLGRAYGKISEVEELISFAEKEMYTNKQSYKSSPHYLEQYKD